MKKINESPLVSVIIPTYKRPGMLGRAIDSVLNQTYQNIEIIVVDDNTDGDEFRKETENFMLRYEGEQRIKYLKHDINKNGSAARNTGARVASGQYIALLDDDDEFLSTKIEKQVTVLQNSGGKYGACYCKFSYYKGKNLLRDVHKCDQGDLSFKLLSLSNIIAAGSTLLIKAEIYHALKGFDENFKRHQDWEFMLRFFEISKICCVQDKLVNVYIDSPINRPCSQTLIKQKELFFNLFKNKISQFNEEERAVILKMHKREVVIVLLKNGEFIAGMKYFMSISGKLFSDYLFFVINVIDVVFPIKNRLFQIKNYIKHR